MSQTGTSNTSAITQLLQQWRGGSEDAFAHLVPIVYRELRGLARRQLQAERDGHTLNTSALVHEAYLNLLGQAAVDWQDRIHFFAIASRTMRRVLVWHARRKQSAKRDAGIRTQREPDQLWATNTRLAPDILALNEALDQLEILDPRLCQVVDCRYFGGLDVDETAAALGVSAATVKRDWRAARAWLKVALDETLQ